MVMSVIGKLHELVAVEVVGAVSAGLIEEVFHLLMSAVRALETGVACAVEVAVLPCEFVGRPGRVEVFVHLVDEVTVGVACYDVPVIPSHCFDSSMIVRACVMSAWTAIMCNRRYPGRRCS